ncbi:MAG: hypothetical protein U0821_21330 [Chloroflexota bacterium]
MELDLGAGMELEMLEETMGLDYGDLATGYSGPPYGDLEIGGIVLVPMIVGLVEVGKQLGLSTVYAAPLAVGLGLLLSVASALAGDPPNGVALAEAMLRGLALGLSAAGLYSGAKRAAVGQAP